MCSRFDNGAFLTEDLTISCDYSQQRALWVAFTGVSLAVYVLGGEWFGSRSLVYQTHKLLRSLMQFRR